MKNIWTTYRVSWTFLPGYKLCASVPADPDIVKKWLEARQPAVRPPGGKSIMEIQEEVFETLATTTEEVPPSLLVFQRHNGGLVMRAATVRAHLKEGARVLSNQYIGRITGERSFATKVINGVYEDPATPWIPILRPDGSPVVSADGTVDKAIHVRGPKGEPLNALKTFEYVEPARMDFRLKVLGRLVIAEEKVEEEVSPMKKGKTRERKVVAKPSVGLEDLEYLFQYGATHGYGGERGDGQGRYMFTVEAVE